VSETIKPSLKPVPDPEVLDRPKRRTFTAAYKLNILRELDALSEPGQVGEVLRREGLYSSHICDWRRLRALGELQALEPKKTGRPKKEQHPLELRLAEAERKAARLEDELRKAHLIIDFQKKVSEMLGIVASSGTGRTD
jgi:transposase-like protein